MRPDCGAPAAPLVDVRQIVKKQPGTEYLEAEDTTLTAWVLALWDELRSVDEWPVPSCPRCAGGHTRLLSRTGPRRPLPLFFCRDCGRMYTRMSDSPLRRLRHPHKTAEFIRLLSQPLSLNEAGRRLHMDYPAVSNWLMRFREFIAEHDLEGIWLTKVRLGLSYRPVGTCGRCGYEGTLHFGGFTPERRRRVICPQCARTWTIDEIAGRYMEMQLARDPGLTAARRLHKAGREAPELQAPESAVLVIGNESARAPEVQRVGYRRQSMSDRLKR
jgi:transposase-like protein